MCCHIFRCCGWILDIIQRILTLIMSCIISCALVCGCLITLSAGIAYGYNASIMEYLDIKKSDITVYVRRGQFGDKPDFVPSSVRRAGGDEPDLFSSNYSVDYQDHKMADNSRPLSDAWQKAQDTSNYADKLTKYSKMKSIMRAFAKDEDDTVGNLPLEESSFNNNVPPSENPDQFPPSRTSSSNGLIRNLIPAYRQLYPRPDDNNQETIKETQKPRRRKKKKHKQKKTEDTIELDNSQSIYLQPNASKYLFRREDFEDEDVEIRNKPV